MTGSDPVAETPISLADHSGQCATRPSCLCRDASRWPVCDEWKDDPDTGDPHCVECGWTERCHPAPLAVMCGSEHPVSGALCRVVGLHDLHDYDGLPDWAASPTTEKD